LLEKEKISNQIITTEITILNKILNHDVLPVIKSLDNYNNQINKSIDSNSNNLLIKDDNEINHNYSNINIKLSTIFLGNFIILNTFSLNYKYNIYNYIYF
jgi:hypothetical protein